MLVLLSKLYNLEWYTDIKFLVREFMEILKTSHDTDLLEYHVFSPWAAGFYLRRRFLPSLVSVDNSHSTLRRVSTV